MALPPYGLRSAIVREPASTLTSASTVSALATVASPLADRRRLTREDGRLPTFDATPEALIARVAIGDQGAFAELYDHLAASVFGTVLRIVRDRSQSEEVTQEVFVEVWKRAPAYDRQRASVRTWALTIAHGRAVDRVRSEQSSREREDRVGRQQAAVMATSPHESVVARIEQGDAATALATLSDGQRDVIVLAYYEGLTQVEISERLGIPIGTVKTRARDGLIRLRQRLAVER